MATQPPHTDGSARPDPTLTLTLISREDSYIGWQPALRAHWHGGSNTSCRFHTVHAQTSSIGKHIVCTLEASDIISMEVVTKSMNVLLSSIEVSCIFLRSPWKYLIFQSMPLPCHSPTGSRSPLHTCDRPQREHMTSPNAECSYCFFNSRETVISFLRSTGQNDASLG